VSRSDLANRVFITDKQLRDLLEEYASQTQSDSEISKKLLKRAEQNKGGCPSLVPLLLWINEDFSQRLPVCKRLLIAISKPSALIGLILRPQDTVPVLLKIAGDKIQPMNSPSALRVLQDNCPVLWDILQSSECKGKGFLTFPLAMRGLIKALAELCEKTAREFARRPLLC
jgi:hypothetical protein